LPPLLLFKTTCKLHEDGWRPEGSVVDGSDLPGPILLSVGERTGAWETGSLSTGTPKKRFFKKTGFFDPSQRFFFSGGYNGSQTEEEIASLSARELL
jgi:hypothetical protein